MTQPIDDSINHEYIIRYIRDTLRPQDGLTAELEEFAAEHEVPISQPETIKLIEVLIRLGKAQSVLELGTAIGYSALRMIKAGARHIDTIEINHDAAEYARGVFVRGGIEDKVCLYEGDAADILPQLAAKNNRYDLIFVDAAKAQYNAFFGYCFDMLNVGGILVSDNVLYKGMTATDDLLLHRKRTIVKRLREYLISLRDDPNLDTALLPVGDGVALSIKLSEDK